MQEKTFWDLNYGLCEICWERPQVGYLCGKCLCRRETAWQHIVAKESYKESKAFPMWRERPHQLEKAASDQDKLDNPKQGQMQLVCWSLVLGLVVAVMTAHL